MTWELTIPNWQPDSTLSLNGRRRSHPMAIAKATAAAKTLATLMLREQRTVSRYGVTDPAHVTVTFVYPNVRRRDPDGLAGMVKPILDAMVEEKLLVDDDCEHITLSIGALVERGVRETRIRVEGPRHSVIR